MSQNYKNLEYYILFLNEFKKLITIIQSSISNYYSNKPENFTDLPNWATPKPWENKVLKNLEVRKTLIEDACDQFRLNNSDDMYDISSDVSSLGKDLDNFNSEWMSKEDNIKYEKKLDEVVLYASNIEHSF